ncbi:DUF6477 family protein [Paracoccus luteus]|uniref:DUF6477 family protein n=1 Tax=Paracoccus luteus TaxID=2508543 RepID=UPI001C6FEC94|nr:DUF6477 family protein [Paracoccus luteus]
MSHLSPFDLADSRHVGVPPSGRVIAFPAQRIDAPLRRPGVLLAAARAGQPGWRRDPALRRLMRAEVAPRPGAALPWLRAEEDRLNCARLEGAADYDMHRHVLVLIALLAELAAVAAGPRLRVVGGA